jgi:hypothetical protein
MGQRLARVTVNDPVVGEVVVEGDGFADGTDPIRLLQQSRVRAHVGLSNAEAERVGELWAAHRDSLETAHATDASASAMGSAFRAASARSRRVLESLLGPHRFGRLERLCWRLRGGDALTEPALADALDLDAAQRAAIFEIAEANEEAMRAFERELTRARITRDELSARVVEHERAASDRLLAILTPAQRERFAGLLEDGR